MVYGETLFCSKEEVMLMESINTYYCTRRKDEKRYLIIVILLIIITVIFIFKFKDPNSSNEKEEKLDRLVGAEGARLLWE